MEKRKINWGTIREELPAQRALPELIEERGNELLRFAATRPVFQLSELLEAALEQHDLSEEEQEYAVEKLLAACTMQTQKEGEEPSWQLKDETRQFALSEFGALDQMRICLPANATEHTDVVQRMLALYISGQALPLEEQSMEELAASLQVLDWLAAYPESLPKTEEVLFMLKKKELFEPFHSLTRHFKGRKDKLEQLSDYVFGESADSTAKKALMVTGVGGAGKTTLLAKFILHSFEQATSTLPFVYIDFDRPGISIREPLTLLLEMARQLALQFPGETRFIDKIRQNWEKRLRRSYRGGNVEQSSTITERDYYLYDADKLWEGLGLGQSPLFLVLDSFEEVQARASDADIRDLMRFLDQLAKQVPRLRTVISGRSEVHEFPTEHLLVGDFDREAALGYLASRDIEDADLASLIFEKVGGNPLTLTLAAGVALKLKGQPNDWLLQEIQTERIQEELFRRNLEHIHQAEVQQLAIPGLVVRRLSPGIIMHVLAGPCGLGEIDMEKAEVLFEKLQKETFLITKDTGTGAIMFRPDLRRLLIDLAAMQESLKARRIHDLAVDFYADKPEPIAQAEWVYHRLKRGDSPDMLPDINYKDIQPFLENAIAELPPEAQRFLYKKFKLKVPQALLQYADTLYWEEEMTERIKISLLKFYEPDVRRLMEQLEERPIRTLNSHLRRAEANLFIRMNDLDKAAQMTRIALQDARKVMDQASELDMCLLLSDIEERQANYQSAQQWAEKGLQLALDINAEESYVDGAFAIARTMARQEILNEWEPPMLSVRWLSKGRFPLALDRWREMTGSNEEIEIILESQLGVATRRIAEQGVFESLSYDVFCYLEEELLLDRVLADLNLVEEADSEMPYEVDPLEGAKYVEVGEQFMETAQKLISGDIAKGKIKEAFKTSSQISKLTESEENDLILLESRFSNLNKNIRMGVIAHEDATIQRNQITKALLSFLSESLKNIQRYAGASADIKIVEVPGSPELSLEQLEKIMGTHIFLGNVNASSTKRGNGFLVNKRSLRGKAEQFLLVTSILVLRDKETAQQSQVEIQYRETKGGYSPQIVLYPSGAYSSDSIGYATSRLEMTRGNRPGSVKWNEKSQTIPGDWVYIAAIVDHQVVVLPLQIQKVDATFLSFEKGLNLRFALGAPVLDKNWNVVGLIHDGQSWALRWDMIAEKLLEE